MASFDPVSALGCSPQFFKGGQELMIGSLLPLDETTSCISRDRLGRPVDKQQAVKGQYKCVPDAQTAGLYISCRKCFL